MRRSLKALPYAIWLTAGSSPLVSANEAVHEAVDMSLPLWSIIPFCRIASFGSPRAFGQWPVVAKE